MSKKTLAMVLVALAVTALSLGYFAMSRPAKKPQNVPARIDRVINLAQENAIPDETSAPSVTDTVVSPNGILLPSVNPAPTASYDTDGSSAVPFTPLPVASDASPVPETDRQAVIAFTFDDGYKSDYELAYPLFKKYGIKGTSYIIGKYPDNDIPDTMTWAQIQEMHEYGWDFGSHTYSHVNLTKLDNDQIDAEIEKESAAFLHHGLPLPQILAFPYGAYNAQVIDAMKPFYMQMRKAFYDEKFVDLHDVDIYALDCVSADMEQEGRLFSREKLVDKACREHAVIVFRVHCMYREQRDDMGAWPVQTSYKMFEQLIDYCVQKGCTFVTMDELMDMYAK